MDAACFCAVPRFQTRSRPPQRSFLAAPLTTWRALGCCWRRWPWCWSLRPLPAPSECCGASAMIQRAQAAPRHAEERHAVRCWAARRRSAVLHRPTLPLRLAPHTLQGRLALGRGAAGRHPEQVRRCQAGEQRRCLAAWPPAAVAAALLRRRPYFAPPLLAAAPAACSASRPPPLAPLLSCLPRRPCPTPSWSPASCRWMERHVRGTGSCRA